MKNTMETILGMVMVVWLLGTFVVVCSLTKDNEWLIPALFGQLFLVWGIVFLCKTTSERALEFQDSFLFLFILVGIGCIAASFIWRFGSEEVLDTCIKILPYILACLTVFVGVFLGGVTYQTKVLQPSEGLEKIEAECVEVKESFTEGKFCTYTVYCPVYSYYYNDKKYIVCSNIYTGRMDLRVGNKYEIYIDPYNPDLFHDPKQDYRVGIVPVIWLIIFVVFPIIVMILYTKTLLG